MEIILSEIVISLPNLNSIQLLLDESCEKKVRFAEEKAPWPTPDPNLVIHPVNKPPHQRLGFFLYVCVLYAKDVQGVRRGGKVVITPQTNL